MPTDVTRKILSGEPISIDVPVPSWLQEEGVTEWKMRQPEDWVWDDGDLIYRAEFQRVQRIPEIARLANDPPSEGWQALRRIVLENAEQQIKELEKLEARTPEQETDLLKHKDTLESIPQTDNWTLAKELAHERASKAREDYLMPRLIVDQYDKPLFAMDSDTGQKRWQRLGRDMREQRLKPYLDEVLTLVRSAKNSDGGEDSAQD